MRVCMGVTPSHLHPGVMDGIPLLQRVPQQVLELHLRTQLLEGIEPGQLHLQPNRRGGAAWGSYLPSLERESM